MNDVNPTAAALLGLLHGGEATGYQLWDAARTFIGDFWTVTRSQAYRELARLEERGMVQAQPIRARSARPYRLTDSGRAAFAEWLAVPPGPENIRYPLLLTLSFGQFLDDDRLLEYVAAHRSAHAERLRRYEEFDADPLFDRYQRSTLRFGIHYERAVLAWMDELPGILRASENG
ncbi:PadR family transcriptional regulator [Streptomyces sp. NPDC059649]|uniref:PadR family transcriptional regulator n=1 Tax=Streptomyces sp. NPDC059649 TaxID=3346895 RepID=UPI003698FCFA